MSPLNVQEGEAYGNTKRVGSACFPRCLSTQLGAGLRVLPFLLFHKTLCLFQSRFRCTSTNPALKESLEAPQELLTFQ